MSRPAILNQPREVWGVAFACVIAFMGIGLVDPILSAIANGPLLGGLLDNVSWKGPFCSITSVFWALLP